MIGKITKIVIMVAIVMLAIWSVTAFILGGPQDSISAHIRDYSAQYPLLPFAFGVLVGHWYFFMGPAEKRS